VAAAAAAAAALSATAEAMASELQTSGRMALYGINFATNSAAINPESDKVLGEIAGLSANPDFRTAKAEVIVDAQIGYEFQKGPLTGLSILAQGKNLTDRPFVTFQNNDPRQVIDYQRYGREYYLGLAYKF
jgi:outer membrane receptor protein involved in Fe transport